MGKLHYLTALLLIILLAIVSGWIFESIEKSPILTKEKPRHDPDYFLKNFTSTTMDSTGKPAYQVKAEHLEHYPDDNSMKLQQPRFSFYENNIISWTVQANEALVLQNSGQILLKGEVILNQAARANKNLTPLRITAEKLTVEPKKNLAHTKSKIKMYKGKSYIQAHGIRADINKSRIEFLSKTQSHYVLPTKTKPQTIDIKAHYLLLDDKKGISKYKGNILFKKDTLIIKADVITLYSRNEHISKALITGSPADVKHQPDNEANVHSQANKLVYFVAKERLLLKGQAFVEQGNRHFSGEKIEYDTRQHTISASSNKNIKESTNNLENRPQNGRVHVIIGPVTENIEQTNDNNNKTD